MCVIGPFSLIGKKNQVLTTSTITTKAAAANITTQSMSDLWTVNVGVLIFCVRMPHARTISGFSTI